MKCLRLIEINLSSLIRKLNQEVQKGELMIATIKISMSAKLPRDCEDSNIELFVSLPGFPFVKK